MYVSYLAVRKRLEFIFLLLERHPHSKVERFAGKTLQREGILFDMYSLLHLEEGMDAERPRKKEEKDLNCTSIKSRFRGPILLLFVINSDQL